MKFDVSNMLIFAEWIIIHLFFSLFVRKNIIFAK